MTEFVLACIGMVAVAVVLFAWPLFKSKSLSLPSANRWLNVVLIAVAISIISGGVYSAYIVKHGGEWHADNVPTAGASVSPELAQAIRQLNDIVKQQPDNMEAWLKLGAANVMAHRAADAVDAYQHAYDLNKDNEVEPITGLAEALLMMRTQTDFMRAASLLDDALRLQPDNPKALWYGGMVALQMNNLKLARDRFRSMLALNPPEQVRAMLEREVQDLNQQLGDTSAAGPSAPQSQRRITVHAKLDPKLQQQIKTPMTMFVLARDPKQPGPPLAVQRRMSSELPLTTDLTAANAMLPSHSIATVDQVEVVVRLSPNGAPIQQAGDFEGSAQYSFKKQGEQGVVNIEINQQVR
jgi:cytochrome c-type biogenesis protein CcmH